MRFEFISLFPEMIDSAMSVGVVSQAVKKELIHYSVTNPREFTHDVHKTIDDRPYGGGDGMIMLAEPLVASLESVFTRYSERPRVIYTSPQGEILNQARVMELAQHKNLVLICGRYGGIDQRVINKYVDDEISIGDYVLSGGELAALAIVDSVARQLPGVLGNPNSKCCDSFAEGLLEAPQFSRPAEFEEQKVPAILTSGNHQKIAEFRHALSLIITAQKRPDLIDLNSSELRQAKAYLSQFSAAELAACGVSEIFT